MLAVKVYRGSECRRFQLDVAGMSLAQFQAQLAAVLDAPVAGLCYLDEEDDKVCLDSQAELAEALKVARRAQPPVLRLVLPAATPAAASAPLVLPAATPAAASAPLVLPAALQPAPVTVAELAEALGRCEANVVAGVQECLASLGQRQALTQSQANCVLEQHREMVRLVEQASQTQTHTLTLVEQASQTHSKAASLVEQVSQATQAMPSAVSVGTTTTTTTTTTTDATDTTAAADGTDARPRHPGVVCDRCGADIVGVRYKCAHCDDFDLCEACESRNEHSPRHMMLKVRRPVRNYFVRGPQLRAVPECCFQPASAAHAQPSVFRVYGRGTSRPHGFAAAAAARSQTTCGSSGSGSILRDAAREIGSRSLVQGRLDAAFIQDVTVPDRSAVQPGRLRKTWRMRNSGTVPWPAEAALCFVEGSMGADALSLPVERSVLPGQVVELTVMLNVPATAGRYMSVWRMCVPATATTAERVFGHLVWCDVHVRPEDAEQESEAVAGSCSSALEAAEVAEAARATTAQREALAAAHAAMVEREVAAVLEAAVAAASVSAMCEQDQQNEDKSETDEAQATEEAVQGPGAADDAQPPADGQVESPEAEADASLTFDDDAAVVVEKDDAMEEAAAEAPSAQTSPEGDEGDAADAADETDETEKVDGEDEAERQFSVPADAELELTDAEVSIMRTSVDSSIAAAAAAAAPAPATPAGGLDGELVVLEATSSCEDFVLVSPRASPCRGSSLFSHESQETDVEAEDETETEQGDDPSAAHAGSRSASMQLIDWESVFGAAGGPSSAIAPSHSGLSSSAASGPDLVELGVTATENQCRSNISTPTESEPVSEPVSVSEPVPEPVSEPVPELVSEPAIEPSPEPAPESAPPAALLHSLHEVVTSSGPPPAAVPATPAPAPQPPVPTYQVNPREEALARLFSMGFFNQDLNIRLLDRYHNDVQRTVTDLLNLTDNNWHTRRH